MGPKYFFTILTAAKIFTRRYLRDRTALFFTIVFPLIFLIIFGSLFGKNNVTLSVDVINQSNYKISHSFIEVMNSSKLFKTTSSNSLGDSENRLSRSQIDGVLLIPPNFGAPNNQGIPSGQIKVFYDKSNEETAQAIQSALSGLLEGVNYSLVKYVPSITVSTVNTGTAGLTYFDFIFSGMLGFTIVILGLLGPSRSIPEFKKQGILRRFHTTPITATQYILASLLSSTVVGFLSLAIMFFVGFHFYHLHMVGSFLNLIIFLVISIVVIYGFGLAIGGWAKSEERAAPLTNLVSFPMMFLSGTFFPTYLMPLWLQNIAKYLPLTPVIDGLRDIISQGKTILNLGSQLLLLAGWMIVIYVVAFMVFRWE